jgi:hypothetical protein
MAVERWDESGGKTRRVEAEWPEEVGGFRKARDKGEYRHNSPYVAITWQKQ